LADESRGPRRVVIEKPFGTDLKSGRELNAALHSVFSEPQVYRIDHYLGKETVQNIMVLRFANAIFEPIWNRNYIDDVKITVAEEVTVGRRAGYYDTAGVMRDFFQNHLLQLLTVTAMEIPSRFEADLVRNEKVKVLQAIRPLTSDDVICSTVRGQYVGYRKEPDVPAESQTATYAALKLHVDNWRWQGVPFYLRSGKAMSCRTTRHREAPSATRTAISRRRWTPRASTKLATLTHAMSNTSDTAPSRSSSGRRASPATALASGSTAAATFVFVAGYSRASCVDTRPRSARAAINDTPGFRRPTTSYHAVFRMRSAALSSTIGR